MLARLHDLSGRIQVADLLKLFLDETNYLATLRLAGQSRALRNVAKLLSDIHNSALVNAADFLAYALSLKDSGSREGEARSTMVGEEAHVPAWVTGSLVHEAIALWRFPGDNFEQWVNARARGKGLTNRKQLNTAVKEVERLLNHFQAWELFPEIEQAERRLHELPYT